mmetsp:Transcript_27803/g.60775  ORF Transcript_27803/g.60775 Transcript_27803/m.60775 type:complete len:278 (+) Transcript_27803:45-878(+)
MASTFGQQLCWSGLLLIAFYSVGCVVFVHLEREAELQVYANNRKLYEDMTTLYSFDHCKDPSFEKLSFCRGQAEFSKSLKDFFNQHRNSLEDLRQWTVLGTMFFLTHLATTIGYGNSHPQTPMGQFATIIFGLVGIPIMGYALALVARCHLRATAFLFEKVFQRSISSLRSQILVLWCLLLVFLLGGAVVYSILEPWSYLESLYFCFVTLSTVGFGDFLPSSAASKVFSMFYMISGLGVCASIIAVLTGFVAEGHESMDIFLSQKIKECGDCCESRG